MDATRDIPGTSGGTSRRTFLRRSAVVGGALIWTAPAVQILDLTAKAAATTSGGTPPGGCFPFFICIILKIKQIPSGCTGWPSVGGWVCLRWEPSTGWCRPPQLQDGHCYTLGSDGTFHESSTGFVANQPVVDFLNGNPSQWKISQTLTSVGGYSNVPAYQLLINLAYFIYLFAQLGAQSHARTAPHALARAHDATTGSPSPAPSTSDSASPAPSASAVPTPSASVTASAVPTPAPGDSGAVGFADVGSVVNPPLYVDNAVPDFDLYVFPGLAAEQVSSGS